MVKQYGPRGPRSMGASQATAARPHGAIFYPRNDEGQSCQAMTYKKNRSFLQPGSTTKHVSVSAARQAQACLAEKTARHERLSSQALPPILAYPAAHLVTCLAWSSTLRIESAIRSAVPIGISPTTVTMASPTAVVTRRDTATVGPS